jgi:hypothetical protein
MRIAKNKKTDKKVLSYLAREVFFLSFFLFFQVASAQNIFFFAVLLSYACVFKSCLGGSSAGAIYGFAHTQSAD